MLKTKLYSAGIIISSFVLMSLTTISDTNSKSTISSSKPLIHMPIIHQFDSGGLCTCIPFSADSNLENAPRIQLNTSVTGFVNAYIKKNGYFLGKTRRSNATYFSIMDAVFEKNELPVELKYLSFVESGLKRNAGSWSGAVGPWALMPLAAKQYGLNISGKKDERLDYAKSTKAAAALLSDLYDEYGDWLLVIAAYNCGPGGIQKAIKKSGSRNYWTLQNFLPEETRKHVKKFIAVHYYFEGHGSVATMTKAETEKHIEAVKVFVEQQQPAEKMDSVAVVAAK
jgi:membrane-bound lytic murein transglycosylase D